ncbi:MAG: hypothetical protein NMNS01_27610 [Nitrosomonas sp.]|nr:MAG: hypothetical protein NMNS01_27610 [Nitrosomonas sp.]
MFSGSEFMSKVLRELAVKSHHKTIFKRRIQALTKAIVPHLKPGQILDVGCGNGMLASVVGQQRPDIEIQGVDIYLRPKSYIPVKQFEGDTLPFDDNTFTSVMIVDVLHHTDNPAIILAECLRVSSEIVVVKDHLYRNSWEHMLLRGMDWVGNAPHGVRLPYNYFTPQTWLDCLKEAGLHETSRINFVSGLYPQPLQWIAGGRIQFISTLTEQL